MRLLLVQDRAADTARLAVALRQQGYAVDVAHRMDDALYQAEIATHGLILAEDELSDATGEVLCRNLRALGIQVPVLLLGTEDTVVARIAALDAGADDCLARPFDPRELLARLRALARRGPLRMDDRLEVHDLEIDTMRRTVQRGTKPIELTAKEYVILEFMARHENELITRAQLAEHAWDRNFDPFSNVIDVYMLRLRRKIDAPFREKLLRTVRGFGYTLSGGSNPKEERKFPAGLPYHPAAPALSFEHGLAAVAGI